MKLVVGFVIDLSSNEVLLIKHRDSRPQWHAGKLNGIGGKVEEGEEFVQAMVREAKEEAGVVSVVNDWHHFAMLNHLNNDVAFFVLSLNQEKNTISQLTDEEIGWYLISSMPNNIIDNLSWLVPMAKDSLESNSFKPVTVEYY